jgi:Pentapeptide repeats (8 copies)
MLITIKNAAGDVLATEDLDLTLGRGPCFADLKLQGANLRAVTLHTDVGDGLHRAWDFSRADLTGADFSGSDMAGAIFHHAILTDAKFDGARLPWCAHSCTGEIVRQAAQGDPDRLTAAAHVFSNRDRDFEWFRNCGHPHLGFALSALAAYVQPDDGSPPWLTEHKPG